MDYMRAHLGEEISLNTLAEIAECTSYHIIRLFKETMGMPPHAYLIQLRLERARELIDEGKSIAGAALNAGFSDQSHLTRRFKKRFGITPGTYEAQKLL
jgi:AraC-like DNA-binding protein